jgi:uncharacterized protein
MRKVVVLGASANPLRFSYKAVIYLLQKRFEVVPIGSRRGRVRDLEILTGSPLIDNVDTLLLYLNSDNQKKYYDYIFQINPGTIIFNPGTENFELAGLAREKGIHVIFDCALNMLEAGEF